MQIGEQIRKLRKKQGLTQAAFAERLFVTPQAVSQWERGVTDRETDKLADIAAVLHTTVNKLTAGEARNRIGPSLTLCSLRITCTAVLPSRLN